MQSHGFKILHTSSHSRARRGKITTPYGVVETPAFVTVGTKATVKSLTPEDFELTGTQFIFVNTYHIVLFPGEGVVRKAGGVHTFSKLNKPIITDSGGFQVYSLARRQIEITHDDGAIAKAHLVKINDHGVEFRSHIDGKKHIFTPEFSIQAQKNIGADFVVALDECIFYGASKEYTKKSLERTHTWAERSLKEFNRSREKSAQPAQEQQIYGIMQGGLYTDLHQKSIEKIASMDFWGIAIGGVAVGMTAKEVYGVVDTATTVLGADPRPRHLLGIGSIEDIVDYVMCGVDTFDCVIPTRCARVGLLYDAPIDTIVKNAGKRSLKKKANLTLDITHTKNKNDFSPVSRFCNCYVCSNYSRAYLHHLFKQKELLAYRLATIHNLAYIEKFFANIRKKIEENKL